jgi:hypothetical protein
MLFYANQVSIGCENKFLLTKTTISILNFTASHDSLYGMDLRHVEVVL